MLQAVVGDRRWLKRFCRRDSPCEVQLVCLHHAGGSAGMYRHWPQLLAPSIETIGVQLPGRADRFHEPPYTRMMPLVDDLVEVLRPLLDRPYAIYGVSMGSRVMWTLTHVLRDRNLPMPVRLYTACDPAPVHGTGSWRWEGRSDGLEGYVREMGGTPPAVLADQKLLAALLPTLDADLTVLSTNDFRPAVPLDVPIRAFAGTDDREASPQQMNDWRGETSARFDLDEVPGGHFFDPEGERQVTGAISRDLA
ncbi:thioesterase [Micromonospora echinospora]|nr:thioesterase [Micromonospora echinospora]